jgi:hypothetical protein
MVVLVTLVLVVPRTFDVLRNRRTYTGSDAFGSTGSFTDECTAISTTFVVATTIVVRTTLALVIAFWRTFDAVRNSRTQTLANEFHTNPGLYLGDTTKNNKCNNTQ